MQIPGFPGYSIDRISQRDWQITSFRQDRRGIVLAGHTWPDGRVFFNLQPSYKSPHWQGERRGVNRQLAFWVLLATRGDPPSDQPWAVHFDDDPSNCDPDNLGWSAPSINNQDRERNGHGVKQLPECNRGHQARFLRYERPNGKPSNCKACAWLSRIFPGRGNVPWNPNEWPELLRPGNEETLVQFWEMPINHRHQLGGLERATVEGVTTFSPPSLFEDPQT
jgi:hypothetical protein